jgi:hypothetical protein
LILIRLRKIFWLERDEVTGEWRRLHKELYDLHSSPNIIRVIKSRKLSWTGHGAYGALWWGNLREEAT